MATKSYWWENTLPQLFAVHIYILSFVKYCPLITFHDVEDGVEL